MFTNHLVFIYMGDKNICSKKLWINLLIISWLRYESVEKNDNMSPSTLYNACSWYTGLWDKIQRVLIWYINKNLGCGTSFHITREAADHITEALYVTWHITVLPESTVSVSDSTRLWYAEIY